LVPNLLVELFQPLVFLRQERRMINLWIQVVLPTLAALF
jgi:hypothetical protein